MFVISSLNAFCIVFIIFINSFYLNKAERPGLEDPENKKFVSCKFLVFFFGLII